MTEASHPFPPRLSSSAARAYAASVLDRYAELGDVPSLTAVDVVDGACTGALRALGLTDPQCRLVLGTLFADRRDD